MNNKNLSYRAALIAVLTFISIAFLWPTLTGGPLLGLGFMPVKPIKKGLDLKGGTHLVYTVQVDEAVTSRLDRTVDSLRNELTKAQARPGTIERVGLTGIKVSYPTDSREKFESAVAENLPEFKLGTAQTDGGNTTQEVLLEAKHGQQIRDEAVEQCLETIRYRVDEIGTTEPVLQRQGAYDILIQLPGIDDPERAKTIIGKTALLEFKLVKDGVDATQYADRKRPVPAGTQFLPGRSKAAKDGEAYIVESRTLLTGDALVDARVTQGDMPGSWVVAFTFNPEGGRRFEELTGNNVNRQLAIVLDGKVFSAPRIEEKIGGGSGIIRGDFKIEEARDLALTLRSGSLAAPLKIAEERTVGPTLGQDSIDQGVMSFIVAGAMVTIFMVVYYRFAGLLADFALAFNALFMLAMLVALQATLTLPGIAGIVLTLGMAVDANVLINERIREELRAGKSARAAIEAGYDRALPAIMDSNITTLLSGIILFQFGSGPIRGFAVTLCIGLVIHVFTAVFCTRVVWDYLLLKRSMKTVSI